MGTNALAFARRKQEWLDSTADGTNNSGALGYMAASGRAPSFGRGDNGQVIIRGFRTRPGAPQSPQDSMVGLTPMNDATRDTHWGLTKPEAWDGFFNQTPRATPSLAPETPPDATAMAGMAGDTDFMRNPVGFGSLGSTSQFGKVGSTNFGSLGSTPTFGSLGSTPSAPSAFPPIPALPEVTPPMTGAQRWAKTFPNTVRTGTNFMDRFKNRGAVAGSAFGTF